MVYVFGREKTRNQKTAEKTANIAEFCSTFVAELAVVKNNYE
jgi:hypothetical protein